MSEADNIRAIVADVQVRTGGQFELDHIVDLCYAAGIFHRYDPRRTRNAHRRRVHQVISHMRDARDLRLFMADESDDGVVVYVPRSEFIRPGERRRRKCARLAADFVAGARNLEVGPFDGALHVAVKAAQAYLDAPEEVAA